MKAHVLCLTQVWEVPPIVSLIRYVVPRNLQEPDTEVSDIKEVNEDEKENMCYLCRQIEYSKILV